MHGGNRRSVFYVDVRVISYLYTIEKSCLIQAKAWQYLPTLIYAFLKFRPLIVFKRVVTGHIKEFMEDHVLMGEIN